MVNNLKTCKRLYGKQHYKMLEAHFFLKGTGLSLANRLL